MMAACGNVHETRSFADLAAPWGTDNADPADEIDLSRSANVRRLEVRALYKLVISLSENRADHARSSRNPERGRHSRLVLSSLQSPARELPMS